MLLSFANPEWNAWLNTCTVRFLAPPILHFFLSS